MKRNLYGKKVFVVDLLTVSLWAFFAWHEVGCGLIMSCYILMRIGLSFELYRNSRWAFSEAMLFAILYIAGLFETPFMKLVHEPIMKMIYVAGCLSGFTEETFDAFSPYADEATEILLWGLWLCVFAWLVLVPLVCSWRYKSILPLYRHKRKIWWYIGCVLLVFAGIVCFDSKDYAFFFLCLCFFMSAAPVAYHIIYRKGSVKQWLLNDRILMSYFVLIATFAVAMSVGLYRMEGVRYIVAIIAPVIIYATTLKLLHIKTIKILPAFLFSLAGLLYINVYDRMHEWVIILLSVGGILSICASVLTYQQCKSVFASLSLSVVSVFILPMLMLGYNPYACYMADNVHSFGNRRGLYMISWKDNVGLRDRYGMLIPPRNQRIYFLDKHEIYLAVLEQEKSYRPENYFVYCLPERRIVVNSYIPIKEIENVDNGEYNMIDENGRLFASFSLPENDQSRLYKDIDFKPRFSETQTPVDGFFERINDGYEIEPGNNTYWQVMKNSNPHAYDLLCKTIAMSGIECSPANDLTFANAYASIVQKDNHYRGNITKSLKDIDSLLLILGAGNQPDLNQCASLECLMESLKLSMSYNGLISYGEIFHDEYVAWHNLMEAVICYYEYISYNNSSDWYSSKPMDIELEKAEWLKQRRYFVDIERDILGSNGQYACRSDSIKNIEDVTNITDMYHCEYDPEYYHPMYNEVAPAFRSWLDARENVAMTLSEHRAISYMEVTKETVNSLFSIVETLSYNSRYMRPVLDWDGLFYKYHRALPEWVEITG